MIVIRSIPLLLYLLIMVLLPWLHMPLHGHETETQINTHHACGHHHDHHEEEPDPSDDCGLCNLTVLPAELPEVLFAPAAIFAFLELPSFQYAPSNLSIQQLHQARAPPVLTV